jgi:hypothetical protein
MAVCTPAVATAASFTVSPGQSIQAAVDAAAPGDTVKVLPGDYTETHGGTAAVRITKSLKLIAKSKLPDVKVRILPGAGNQHGILVEPASPGDADVEGVKIKGFTIEGFPKNGIWLRHVDNFKIERNESIANLENGIFPTLSANGQVKRNVSYGSEDSALWVEASENVRVIKNELYNSPTGLEITVSNNVVAKKNDVHDNTVGIGLYHPSAASLPPLQPLDRNGYWEIVGNRVYNNNNPNNAPPGSMAAALPRGIGILVLGVDNVTVEKNQIENNDFLGLAVVDYCLAVDGTDFDCDTNPPEVESAPDNNQMIKNTLVNNGLMPDPGPFAALAADILSLPVLGTNNCFSQNTTTGITIPPMLPEC